MVLASLVQRFCGVISTSQLLCASIALTEFFISLGALHNNDRHFNQVVFACG